MNISEITTCLKIASGIRGYSYPSGIWRRSLKGLPGDISGWFRALQGELYLLQGRHDDLAKISEKHIVLLYYKAYDLYICGKFSESLPVIMRFCDAAPRHSEGMYLLSDIYEAMHDKENAFRTLSTDRLLSRRKTWIRLANLVVSPQHFDHLQQLYDRAVKQKLCSEKDVVILENLALGAQRAGEYEKALHIWKSSIVPQKGNTPPAPKKLTPSLAREALQDLTSTMNKSGLELFLISGTLLGLIRDGNFLCHDTDLDTGIFHGFHPEQLKNAIYASGRFTIMAQRSPHCLRIRHVNGTPIDIFTHYRTDGDFWHGGVKVRWHNSPFGLKPARFLGLSVLIPDNPEKYLEENYGADWRTPREQFDSAMDCPNYTLENESEFLIHQLKKGSAGL